MQKLLQAKVWPRFWAMLNWVVRCVKGFIKVVTWNCIWIFRQNQAEIWPRFWNLLIGFKHSIKFKDSKPWVRCAFGNVSYGAGPVGKGVHSLFMKQADSSRGKWWVSEYVVFCQREFKLCLNSFWQLQEFWTHSQSKNDDSQILFLVIERFVWVHIFFIRKWPKSSLYSLCNHIWPFLTFVIYMYIFIQPALEAPGPEGPARWER